MASSVIATIRMPRRVSSVILTFRYLIFPNGNLAIRMYNQTNDRYFTHEQSEHAGSRSHHEEGLQRLARSLRHQKEEKKKKK